MRFHRTVLDTETAAADIVTWAKVIDHSRCIGCHACTTACKSENEVPLSVTRTYVKYVDIGNFPRTRRAFQVTRCNQCDHAPCVTACPTRAMFRRPDGIVDFDKSICIGCKACIAACPYDAIFINPDDHSAEKCNFCAHRIDMGLEPACVVVCPTEAILVGDLNDPMSKVSRIVHHDAVMVRRPEKETRPKLFYKGAHQLTLDPLAARRPGGGLFMWSEQPDGPGIVNSGHPDMRNSSAAALLSYDVAHRAPWDWRVSLYTWTKGLATGVYLMALGLALAGLLPWNSPWVLTLAPALGLLFLAITGVLLIADLEHPERFHMIFTRPQWRSWLVRGAFIITAYAAVLMLHIFLAMLGREHVIPAVAVVLGIPLAALTAVYTAYLFAQAKGRDLWQNPLGPTHLVVQALLVGAALMGAIEVVRAALQSGPVGVRTNPVMGILIGSLAILSAVHLLLLAGEHTLTHGTAHARLASREMTRGRFAPWFTAGLIFTALGVLAPWLGAWTTLPVLLGVLAYEHAYVQAGQSVPLA
jgi:Fe-S-cluster-containing dehydrogenase component/formate-dependent nitrite reductase membrane component NrfD